MMRERRFLTPGIVDADEVEIRDDGAHHLLHVLRLRPGDEIVVFDGEGHEFRAILTRFGRRVAVARKLDALRPSESGLELALAVSVPKGDRMSTVVRMATELGVRRIIPLVSERTTERSREVIGGRLPHWRRIVEAACKQSGRAIVPEVVSPLDFCELLELDRSSKRMLICPEGDPLPDAIGPTACLAAVGPEGGWTPEEVSAAVGQGFRTLRLGPRTLRTETAALAAIAILQWAWGDLTRPGSDAP